MKNKIHVPPIKIQGIKTKLVPWIKENIETNETTRWVEPFLGSGVVGFNLAGKNALFADSNPHTINFYNQLKNKELTSSIIKQFLYKEGQILSEKGQEHYNYVRSRFNEEQNPIDFLFLNRSCFNGMIRFNRSLKFNVPYGHKPERFAQAYITKIVNQVKYLEFVFSQNNWEFKCQSFEDTLNEVTKEDFVYCDPPYIGRHVDYYDSWDEKNEIKLHDLLTKSGANFMLSTWDNNEYRENEYLKTVWKDCNKLNKEHFYHIGAKETNRKPMIEALITNYKIENKPVVEKKAGKKYVQLDLFSMIEQKQSTQHGT
ncbi:MAG: Dam family site-specific DNA-(adenine-N6)-methyltransferase [Bacteroidales bacterium]|nr:Dam family site-specific DNA-(adenine-N6)-methyltransferase [Bacteroidales bacterium]